MDVIKFGFRYWKRNLALSILAKLMSGLALTADLLLPMITALFVDYVIKDSKNPTGQHFFFHAVRQIRCPSYHEFILAFGHFIRHPAFN